MLFTRTNTLMDSCLAKLDVSDFSQVPVDMVNFSHYILSDFITHQDCILLATNISQHCQRTITAQTLSFSQQAYPHCTALECGENHVHITDFLTERSIIEQHSLELLYMGLGYTEMLRTKLKNQFPNHLFRIILTYKLAKIDPDDDMSHDCIVRFHKIRAGELWTPPSSEAVGEVDIV